MNYHNPLLAVGLLLSLTISLSVQASLSSGTAAGQRVVYSSLSDISWTGDANLLASMISNQGYSNIVNAIIAASPIINDTPNGYDGSFGNYDALNGRPFSGIYQITADDFSSSQLGQVSWFGANAFVNYLNSISYAGSKQWTLPSAGINPQAGCNLTGGQLGVLFYNELGGIAHTPIPNTNYFSNEQAAEYWLGTVDNNIPSEVWLFNTYHGFQGLDGKRFQYYAWPVSPGNIATTSVPTVPLPGAVWLFGSGVIGLMRLERRGNLG